MVKKENITTKLRIFKSKLAKNIPLEKMILFGSTVKNKTHKDSDVDVIIVSPKFRGIDFRDRALGFYKYWDLDYPFDFLCYTPEEFNKLKKQITIVREAVKEGIEI